MLAKVTNVNILYVLYGNIATGIRPQSGVCPVPFLNTSKVLYSAQYNKLKTPGL